MVSNSIATPGPERTIIIVSTRLNNDFFVKLWSRVGAPIIDPILSKYVALASPIEITSTVDRLAIDSQIKLGLLDQVCKSPIQKVPIYDVSISTNQYYTPSDGSSTHDAHPDGYGYDSAPQSFISLMTPEYKPPAFDYSNGLCYIPPRKASLVYYDHGVGLFYWGLGISVYGSLYNATCFAVRTHLSSLYPFLFSEYQQYEYPFRPPYDYIGGGETDYIGEGDTDYLECWYSLTTTSNCVRSCFIALGMSEIRNNFIIFPTNSPALADESTPSMRYLAIKACRETPTAVLISPLAV
eukprot:6203799-Pleurochrysis_carterae.AAC.1